MPDVVTADGVRLSYLDEGSGSTIVLLGGFLMGAKAWRVQLDALAPHHRVIALDRRHHGDAERPAGGHRLSRHAADVHDALVALDLDEVLLVGASMGASTIYAYLDLFGTERLRGIVPIDQTPKMINEGDWSLGFYDLTRENVDAFIAGFPGALNPFHKPTDLALRTMLAGGTDIDMDVVRPLLRNHAEADWRDVFARCDVPVLAIAGRHCPLWPCESSLLIADAAPQGEALVCEESGHVPFLEEPELVNGALAAFAAR
jgi:pimeloyl-ACP methyl ester carboxylesterase